MPSLSSYSSAKENCSTWGTSLGRQLCFRLDSLREGEEETEREQQQQGIQPRTVYHQLQQQHNRNRFHEGAPSRNGQSSSRSTSVVTTYEAPSWAVPATGEVRLELVGDKAPIVIDLTSHAVVRIGRSPKSD